MTDEDTIDDWVGKVLVLSITLNVDVVLVVIVFVGNTVSTTERKQQIQCHSYNYMKNFMIS